ncbi:hypothetical protein HMPREF3033_01562 [Veillonellaceae bacterium DNF00751]|nr:hypothetical protein HMPREF3033_01562 [Veillonellaceae bacterium DNF00751]
MRIKQLPPPGGPGHSCHRRLGLYDQADDERGNNGGPDGGAAYGRKYRAGLSGAAVKKSPAYAYNTTTAARQTRAFASSSFGAVRSGK